jgi:hypothetical protein
MQALSVANVVDNLITLECAISALYLLFAKLFPEDAAFWNQLAEEEVHHADLLRNYKNYLPLEFQKMDKKKILQTEEYVRKSIIDFKAATPHYEAALHMAYMLENNIGEIHYQGILDSCSDTERTRIFQVLNFADKDHAKRIQTFLAQKNQV